MNLYPAIDLKGGAVVRLLRGDMNAATEFNADPADQARQFAAAGCAWLHVVDLDGAFTGAPRNAEAVAAIRAAVGLRMQLGGGIRGLGTIEAWLERGVDRVILGTAAVKDPDLVRAACRRFPGQVAVGIDARRGRVAVEGWAETSDIAAEDLAGRFGDAGVAAIIHTDIDRDGAMKGANVAASAALARAVPTPVIVSGGVRALADLEAARAAGNLEGVVVGRALYDGAVEAAAALRALGGAAVC